MLKSILIIIFSAIVFYSCSTDKDNMIIIKDYIKDCTKDIVEMQLKDGTREKAFEFRGQAFSLYIDSTGKPVFWKEGKDIGSIDFKIEEKKYSVELKDGIIKVGGN